MKFSEMKEYQPIGNGWNRAKTKDGEWVNIHDTELTALATGNKDLLPKGPLPPIPRPQ